MANKRIDQLNASPGFDDTDLFEKERDPGGAKAHEKATLLDFANWMLGKVNYNVYRNLAELRANTVYIDSRVYCTLGDYVKGDGQAKIYYFDETVILADNGGSVIKPDAIADVDPGRYLQFNV